MTFKMIEVVAPEEKVETIVSLATELQVSDIRSGSAMQDRRCVVTLLVGEIDRQQLLDHLQNALHDTERWRITMIPTDAVMPHTTNEEALEKSQELRKQEDASRASREELYSSVTQGARMDSNFFLLAILSTVVASVGLMQDNVAVVIGAMVIAPLLGPNMAFAFAVGVGDQTLMLSAGRANFVGVGLSILLAATIALFLPPDMESSELMARTTVGYDGVALALASGAAAALSLTTGLSSTLVGVMVAVALLPPAATLGMMLTISRYDLAIGAAMLLMANIACINLSAQIIFMTKGLRPRKWFEREKARQAVMLNLLTWVALLSLLLTLIAFR